MVAKARAIIFFVGVSLFFSSGVWAQQEGLFSAQSSNWFLRNPAISGWEDYIDIRATYRRQWIGMPQVPEGYYVTAHAPLNYFEQRGRSLPMLSKYSMENREQGVADKSSIWYRHGLGATLLVQNNRPFRTNIAQASYAIHLKVSKKAKISFGASLGIRQWRVNIDDLLLGNEDDPAFEPSFVSEIVPSVGVGGLVYHPNYFLSFSSSQVVEERLSLNPEENTEGGILERHYYAGGGYRLNLAKIAVSPRFMLRYVPSIGWTNDFLLQVSKGDSWWASASYRVGTAVGAQVGYAVKPWLRVSYAYELTANSTTQELGRHTHEISLSTRIAVRQYGLEQRFF